MSNEEQVHYPDIKESPEAKTNGLVCWLDSERFCGSDCMAYAEPPLVKGPDYDGKQWANCILLSSTHQAAKHVAVLAQHLVKQSRTPAPPRTSVG